MKKKAGIWIGAICISVVFLALFSSCGNKAEKYSAHSFDYFDTVTTVMGYASDREEFDRLCDEIFLMLEEYHKLFTIYDRYEGLNNLCTINSLENGVHPTVRVDARIIDLLLYAKEMYEKTDGKMNIAMGSVLSLWHDYRQRGLEAPLQAALPPMEKLLEASAHTNIDDLLIDEENGTVTITDPQMTLDVGAVAKGYAVEMTARALEEKGVTGYVINVGGNVRTIGEKDDGTPWRVGIENPDEESAEPYFAYLDLAGESVVTSGSYQRYYIVNGVSYHHIIDPATLMPSEKYLSVSVICGNSADGDALSTALFCMSAEDGLALLETLEGIEAMWVFPNGEKQYSDGFSDYTSKDR